MKTIKLRNSTHLWRGISVIFLIVGLYSCTQQLNNELEKPENFISHEQMVDILVDMQLMEEIISSSIKPRVEKDEEKYLLYQSIMVKHNINKEQFKESYYYYKDKLEELDQIYEEVSVKLQLIQSDLKEEKEIEK